MRVLMLNYEFPPLGGGGGVAAKVLAKGFVKNGYVVDYITTWFPGLKEYEVVDGIHVHRVKVIGRKSLPTASMTSMMTFLLPAYRKGVLLCSTHKYAFINTHFAVPTGPVGVWLSRKFGIKNVLSLHGGDIYDPTKKFSPHRWRVLRATVRWVMNHSTVIVAQSTNTRDNALKYYTPAKKIKIIPLPYEPFRFRKVSRKTLGLRADRKYLIGVGRLVVRKRFDRIISALPTLDKHIEALIIGSGPEEKNLQELAKSLKVTKRVHFLGQVSEEKKFQYLNVADLFVLSSEHEGFGIVLLEAMQVGLPIVATGEGGWEDLPIKKTQLNKKLFSRISRENSFTKHNLIYKLQQFRSSIVANKYSKVVA